MCDLRQQFLNDTILLQVLSADSTTVITDNRCSMLTCDMFFNWAPHYFVKYRVT